MKIVIPGGSGQVGRILQRSLVAEGHEVVVLSRGDTPAEPGARLERWDGLTMGAWINELDGADAVINLAGRSVSCRYTETNLRQMMDSRVESARVVGQAIAAAGAPPKVWLQMSTATIYADTRDGFNDESTGTIGGAEPGVPSYWEYSVRIAKNWEAAQLEVELPSTRRVALRSAMVMSADKGGIFDVLSMLARSGLGGSVAGGQQMVSWIHGGDFARAVSFLLTSELAGPVNLCSPNPLPQTQMLTDLRHVWGRRFGLPATKAMASIGAWALRTDPELLLKSRSVIPGRLLNAGFSFEYAEWTSAAEDLASRARQRPEGHRLRDTLHDVIALGRAR